MEKYIMDNMTSAILITVLGFFLRSFYNKFCKMSDNIGELNSSIKVALNDQKHLVARVEKTESEINRLWKGQDKSKETMHDIKNGLALCKLNKLEIDKLKEE